MESKSGLHGSPADRLLRELGVHPASVSKYCIGVAALHPELPSNPWHPTLRRYFEPLPPDPPGAQTPSAPRRQPSPVHRATGTTAPGAPGMNETLSVPQFPPGNTTPDSRAAGTPHERSFSAA
jgi:hypothetical protein